MSKYLSKEDKDHLLQGMDYNKAMTLDAEVLQELKSYLESQEDFDRSVYGAISNALLEMQSMAENIQEAEVRQQKQAEHMDGLLQAIIDLDLFGAIEPKPENGERLHEYESRRKDFNIILHEFFTEQQKSLINDHNAEIEQKDEKIRLLNKQCLEVQQQLDETKSRLSAVEDEADAYQEEMLKAQQESKDKDAEIARLKSDLAQKDQTIDKLTGENADLKRKLDQQKPVEYQKPSGSITERVNSLREKSSLNKSVEDRLASFYERNKGLIPPKIGIQEEQPSGDTFHTPTETGTTDKLAYAEGTSNNPVYQEVNHFRMGDDTGSVEGVQQEAESGDRGNEQSTMGTLEEAFKRLIDVEQRLDALEQHTNIKMSA